MSTTPSTTPAASPENDRILSLNVLRGIALMGILVISIWEFGGFTNATQNFYRTGTHGGNYKLLTTVSMLFEGKMRALLAIVFGAGIVLFMQKKQHAANITAADAYMRKQVWYMVFGVFNAFILLWPGDILFSYGVVGILVFAFWRMSSKGLFIAAVLCTLIYCGKQYWNYTDDKKDYKKYIAVTLIEKKFKQDSSFRAKKDSIDRTKDTIKLKDTLLNNKRLDSIAKKNDTLTSKQAGEKGKWEGLVKSFKYDTAAAKANRKTMWGGWGKIWNHLKQKSQNKGSDWLYKIGVWDIGSMMFLGMALLGMGFFQHRLTGIKYTIIAIVLLGIGFVLAWYRVHYNVIRLADYAKFVEKHALPYNLFFPIERALLATGYAAGIMALLKAKWLQWLWQAVAAAGSMALTNYIMQTIICTFFFYGYGFAYYGRLQQWELYFMVAEIVLVQIVFSVLWLRYYTMGPLEWALRCMIYRKWLPIKKGNTV